jgi:hypothetical protein
MREIAKRALWVCLSLGLCRSAFAAPASEVKAEAPIDLQDVELTGRTEAPIELQDVELTGRTVAPRPEPKLQLQGLVLLHVADGVGAGGQLRFGNFGLRASVAYQPQHFIVDEDPADDEFPRFELKHSAQLNLDALCLFGASERGASLSYRYSTLLGHGLGAAYQSYVDLAGARFALSIPVVYYPAASERVRRELGLSGGERVNFPFGPGFEYGIGVAWLF